MNWDSIIKLIIQVALFLGATYLIFYKNWLKALGNEVAKLVTVKDLTKVQESIKSEFNLKLEEQKSKLNEDFAFKIEPIKAELSKNNITHQIQFTYLHQERGKIIVEFYQKLVELHSAMISWTAFMHPIIENAELEAKERTERANKAFNELRNFYLLNKLYFPKSFCDSLDKIIDDYWNKLWDYGFRESKIREGAVSGDFYRTFSTEMSQIREELKVKLPIKITEIEAKFRQMLNVEEEL